MAIDLTRIIGAVTREISEGERDGAATRGVIATRNYDTSLDDLWDAITNAERIPRWFLPISGDLRLGGHYQLEGNASGEIVQCEPPRRLGLTWGMHGQVSWVDVQLSEDPAGGTLLRIEHTAPYPDEMWDQYGPGAGGVGWDSGLLGLDQYISGEAAVRPEDAAAWLATDEGRSFIRQSSDAWCAAAIAAGADPDAARASAERTTAAYTGDAEAPQEP
jgi:uncharacterized protein YndB with AHSA1/START domain